MMHTPQETFATLRLHFALLSCALAFSLVAHRYRTIKHSVSFGNFQPRVPRVSVRLLQSLQVLICPGRRLLWYSLQVSAYDNLALSIMHFIYSFIHQHHQSCYSFTSLHSTFSISADEPSRHFTMPTKAPPAFRALPPSDNRSRTTLFIHYSLPLYPKT